MAEWTKAEVLKQLRSTAKPGKPVRAQVFLNDDVGSGDLQAAVQKLVTAAQKLSRGRSTPQIGKIHKLAKSFSVNADVETIAALTDLPDVKTVLPEEVSDIYPKPVKE
jgi:hypothetical protein